MVVDTTMTSPMFAVVSDFMSNHGTLNAVVKLITILWFRCAVGIESILEVTFVVMEKFIVVMLDVVERRSLERILCCSVAQERSTIR